MLRSRIERRRAWLLFLALFVAGAAGAADPAAELRLSVAVGPVYALGKAAEQWAKSAGERLGPTLGVRVFAGAALAQREPTREFLALRDGAAELAVGSSLAWSTQVKELGAVSLPWIAPSTAQLRALASAPLTDRWRSALERSGVVLLAAAPLGHRVLLARSDRIHAPADFAGLRLRTQPAPLLTAFYEALGAQPTWMTATAARTAAAAGELDAEDGSAAALAAARLDALGFKYLTIWGATGELALFAVNGAVWSGMTEAQRAAVQDTADEAAAALATLARQEEDRALDTLRQRGVTITRLLAPSQAAFAEAAKPMTQRWTEAIGAELVQEVRAAAAAAP